jgi:hypothetical protein
MKTSATTLPSFPNGYWGAEHTTQAYPNGSLGPVSITDPDNAFPTEGVIVESF